MFFVLSKTLGGLLLPSNVMVGTGIIGLILLVTRFVALGRRLVAASVLLLAVCGFSPLANWLLYPLEARFPPWDDSRGAPIGIVVLGGAIDADISAAHGVAAFGASVDRLIAAAGLARRYPNARIIFAGGNPNLLASDAAKEADFSAMLFESLGFSTDRLIMERRSRNTSENAEFSKALASPKSGERWLLVTSAYHMARAVGAFRKAAFDVEPYPVDWRMAGRSDLLAFSVLPIERLKRLDLAAREWMGLVAYWMAGRTDELFPGARALNSSAAELNVDPKVRMRPDRFPADNPSTIIRLAGSPLEIPERSRA